MPDNDNDAPPVADILAVPPAIISSTLGVIVEVLGKIVDDLPPC